MVQDRITKTLIIRARDTHNPRAGIRHIDVATVE
jgi:hypothetical protein